MENNKKTYVPPVLGEWAFDKNIVLMSGSVFEHDEDELIKINSRASDKSHIFPSQKPVYKSPDRIAPDNISGNSIF